MIFAHPCSGERIACQVHVVVMNLKKGMSRLLAALLLMFLAACGKTATSGGEDEIKIGAIFSASGGAAPATSTVHTSPATIRSILGK
ncbi:hypothetical protein P9199_04205 [Geobacillus stearothermophilus]|uniref:hypothetical protein n=1 Tax=Geobacillus stearothermophilus TaxID=1422 RepID=UPI002E1EC80F|nr:hypothetical protein [Geobacillus stearothermophilus]